MSRSRTTVFAMLAALTIVAAVFVNFLLTRSADQNVPPIILPPEVSEGIDEQHGGKRDFSSAPPQAEINSQNLASVILSLERPEEYYAEYTIELMWDGGTSSSQRKLWQSGENISIEILNADGTTLEHNIITGGYSYIWREGDRSYYKGTTGEFSGEDTMGLPTYLTLAQIPADEIIDCFYTETDAQPCVYAETGDAAGQTIRWWITLDDGLLSRCETWNDGQLAINRIAVLVEQGAVGIAPFRLPDGNYAIEE